MWIVCVLVLTKLIHVQGQYYYPQNATNQPIQKQLQSLPGPPNRPATSYPFPYPSPYGAPLGQPPQPVPYPSMGYPLYPGFGYPPPPQKYPVYPQGYGYPFPYQQGIGGNQPGFGQIGSPYPQQSVSNGFQDQNLQTSLSENITAEILDVSSEYQRQLLGWPPESASSKMQVSKPRYRVDIDSQTSNHTSIPSNLTKPIITERKYTTSIKRTFVYDPSKTDQIKPINIHIVNGQQVTTAPPPTTTENEEVEEYTSNKNSTIKPQGRRFMDVPKSCPKGTLMAHNGDCIEPFSF